MLFVFAYVACALPHAPRFEARGDGALIKKLSKRVQEVPQALVWREPVLYWHTQSFWGLPGPQLVNFQSSNLKEAWEARKNKVPGSDITTTAQGHTAELGFHTTFGKQRAIIDVFITDDEQAAKDFISTFREGVRKAHHRRKEDNAPWDAGDPFDGKIAFGSQRNREGQIRFMHVTVFEKPEIETFSVQDWDVSDFEPLA